MNLMVMLMYMKQWKTQQIQQVVGCQQITDLIFSIGWSLKELIFEDMYLSKGFLLVMLMGCDVIERLVLKNISGISQDLLGEITSDVGRDIPCIYWE